MKKIRQGAILLAVMPAVIALYLLSSTDNGKYAVVTVYILISVSIGLKLIVDGRKEEEEKERY
jgi:hypothetical protein